MRPIPPSLVPEIQASLEMLYGSTEFFSRVEEIAQRVLDTRPAPLREEDRRRTADWYKEEVVYMFYPDQFGVSGEPGLSGTFETLCGMLDYLQTLGVTTLYILPFMDSPMGDAGFDVRDPLKVRADLGGLDAFDRFSQEARKRGFKLKADLILNHFSDQHAWFQAALRGDTRMLERFLLRRTLPCSRTYTDPQRGVVVDYVEENGRISSRRLIFPDMSKDHYRHVELGGQDYYLYHTFYPFQLDINWENPEVLWYVLEVIGFWANRGIDIFRMDAIPYFIKEPGTDGENLPLTHRVVKLLSAFLQAVAPRSVIQAEACQWPKDILPYFGRERTIVWDDRSLVRTDEVQLAYNFPYMPAIWASLVTGDRSHFWRAFYGTPTIPSSAAWSIFLRVHDELTLEMVDPETRAILYERLLPKGAEFRKGLGVAGRLADFLDRDPKKIEQAFAIMLSLPGMPTLYFGDEIGATNNWEYARSAEAQRRSNQENQGVEVLSFFDSRDINRGPLPKDAFYGALTPGSPQHEVFERVRRLIGIRRETAALTRGDLTEIPTENPALFAFKRQHGDQCWVILHNLSDRPCDGRIEWPQAGLWVDAIREKPFDPSIPLPPRQSLWLRPSGGT